MRDFYNASLFVFMGIVFGIVFAWGTLSENFSLIDELLNSDVYKELNAYFLTAFSAFVATVFATSILMLFRRMSEYDKILSEIQSARIIHAEHLNNLLNFKIQHVKLHFDGLSQARDALDRIHQGQQVTILLSPFMDVLSDWHVDFSVKTDFIAKYSRISPLTLTCLIKSESALMDVLNLLRQKNSLVIEYMSKPRNDRWYYDLLGVAFPEDEDVRDSRFYDVTKGLLEKVNVAIFLNYETIVLLENLAKKCLPQRHYINLAILDFNENKFKESMPDMDVYRKRYLSL